MLESRLGRGLLVMLGCYAAGLLAATPGVATPGELDSSFGRMGEFALQTNPACNDGCPEHFGSNAQALALEPDGRLLIAGQNFDHQRFYNEPHIEGSKDMVVRLNRNGTLDSTFGSAGFAQTVALEVRHVYANGDGSITGVGLNPADSFGEVGIERYTAYGASAGSVQWFDIPDVLSETAQIDSKGRLVVFGITTPPLLPHGSEPKLMRFLPTGALDRSFGKGGVISLQAPDVTTENPPSGPETFALGKDGSVFMAATTYSAMGEHAKHIVIYRFTPNGKPDRSFGQEGMVVLQASKVDESLALAVAPDGDIVLAAGEDMMGSLQQVRLLVVRYTKTGRPDGSFGSNGVAARAWNSISPDLVPSAVTFDARGDTVIAGTNTYTPNPGSVGKWFLARLTSNGFDCSFGSHGVALGGAGTSANAVAAQPDGRIVIAGERNHEFAVARYMGGGAPRTCSGEHKSHKPKHKHSRKQRHR